MLSCIRTAAIAAVTLVVVSAPAAAQTFQFQFGKGQFRFEKKDPRGNVAGKRASCEVYARIAVVQAEANRQFQCRYEGPRWITNPVPHFRWCRWAGRPALVEEFRERAQDLQRCFDNLGDFDEGR
jgi:hypothetical protein